MSLKFSSEDNTLISLKFFPEGSTLSRTTAKVAEERMASLREYLEALMKLDVKYLSCEIMEEFFAVNDDDLLFMKDIK